MIVESRSRVGVGVVMLASSLEKAGVGGWACPSLQCEGRNPLGCRRGDYRAREPVPAQVFVATSIVAFAEADARRYRS